MKKIASTTRLTKTIMGAMVLVACHAALAAPEVLPAVPTIQKPRIIVTSDGEIDDECSMVRSLLHANEWGIDGIITSNSQYNWQGHKWASDDWAQAYIIVDHVSASWGDDETMTLYHGENITVQWCMITETLNRGGSHGFGGIWGSHPSTYHHNLIAHNVSRNPRLASGCGNVDYRNNVLYNWEYNTCYGAEGHQKGDRLKPPVEFSHVNLMANYYKPGPATRDGVKSRLANPSTRDGAADAGKWWVEGNIVEGSPEVTADNWKGVNPSGPEHGLDPSDASDGAADRNDDGHTNLEDYLNGLVAR